VFGVAATAIVGFIAYQFIAALTVAVFVYYATRGDYKALAKLRLPARIRAVVVLASLAVPLVLLLSYTVALLAIGTRQFVAQYPVLDVAENYLGSFGDIDEFPELTLQGIYETYQAGQLEVFWSSPPRTQRL
jgi:predicted PurR-regulated permease PerM